jgi:phosphate acetyltransferase
MGKASPMGSPIAERLMASLRTPGPRIAFGDGTDERVVAAAQHIAAGGWARPVLLGGVEPDDDPDEEGKDRAPVELLAADAALTDDLVALYAQERHVSPRVAARVLQRSDALAVALVRARRADAAIIGAAAPMHDAVTAGAFLGLADKAGSTSGVVLVEASDGAAYLLGDCSVHAEPDGEALAAIAHQTARTARRLFGVEPRIAFVASTTRASGEPSSVDPIRDAVASARHRELRLLIDGDLQADAAVDARSAAHKLDDVGNVAGQANVLVLPNVQAAEIAAKVLRSVAGASVLGTFLQGYRAPVAKISRGVTVDEIVATAAVLVALAE